MTERTLLIDTAGVITCLDCPVEGCEPSGYVSRGYVNADYVYAILADESIGNEVIAALLQELMLEAVALGVPEPIHVALAMREHAAMFESNVLSLVTEGV